ncbi:MAG TPA: glycosyltransferase [Bryobacteraceae bacterium]|nr:glycosyltransferase [Bryobacteraceae bacterium]
MIYTHVRLLCANGIDAAVLHNQPGFRPSWMNFDAPRLYLRDPSLRIGADDLLIVPEVHAGEREVCRLTRRRVVFVQASSYIAPGLRNAADYRALGYAGAISIMPHVREIVERHYGVKAPVIPPSIAPWFFADDSENGAHRKHQVVICPKAGCRDFPIVRQMLRAGARRLRWKVVELENQNHRRVAQVFRQAAIHVNVNCQESFNATVPEAMAAGCIPFCYEAFGGRDFLRHRKNACVFPTHHAYPLVESALELMASWDARQKEVERIRSGGYATARRYTESRTEKALLEWFRSVR